MIEECMLGMTTHLMEHSDIDDCVSLQLLKAVDVSGMAGRARLRAVPRHTGLRDSGQADCNLLMIHIMVCMLLLHNSEVCNTSTEDSVQKTPSG